MLFQQIAVAVHYTLFKGVKQCLGTRLLIRNQSHLTQLHLQIRGMIRNYVCFVLSRHKTPQYPIGAMGMDDRACSRFLLVYLQVQGPFLAGLAAAQTCTVHIHDCKFIRLQGTKAASAPADVHRSIVEKAYIGR